MERKWQPHPLVDNTTEYVKNDTWLQRFVNLVGKENVFALTQNARIYAEEEKRMLINQTSSKIDWNRININGSVQEYHDETTELT
mmetsp:Transcript_24404/g.34060  ORF Transcript_24404/g.34060 Transcript_24404/m.34060 type:complete len:85 (-) Transcript_24404:77-331(-)